MNVEAAVSDRDGKPGHVFVSYERGTATEYAGKLVTYLEEAGVPAWYDGKIPPGARWDMEIRASIAQCAVLALVMTPGVDDSEWVPEEIDEAKAKAKIILPLLLQGEPVFGFRRTQYEDVSGGRMPSPAWLRHVRGILGMELGRAVHRAQPPMPHANYFFISYDRKDTDYVQFLRQHLVDSGIPVWTDDQIDFGARWDDVLRRQLDSCSAMLVVMSQSSKDSRWVDAEIRYAQKRGKRILPLLLSGEVFTSLTDVKYYEDVRGGREPSVRFTWLLRHILSER